MNWRTFDSLMTKFHDILIYQTRNTKITTFDLLLMIIIRLRTYLPYRSLAPLFNLSCSTIYKHVDEGVHLIGIKSKSEIRFPPRNERLSRAKYLTLNNYTYKVSWIIDGLHQKIMESDDPDIKIGTFSNKVSSHSVKILIITDPNGTPFWISNTYSGRPHDSQLIRFPENNEMIGKRE